MAEGGLVTLLFTDLVRSTELLARAGDEDAQRIFRAHRQLLTHAVAVHGGHEVKWLGDGLMVAFPSAADAVGCAIAMQQASRRPVEGEHLAIRVGLNAGEALRDVDDYFGTPVVVARRLCDRAEGGQILCTETVAGLLAGRAGFGFTELGKLALKGVPEAVAACEVRYEVTATDELPARLPMVGRDVEFGRLVTRLAEAIAGRGGLVTIIGEPGIGKTRMLEELTERARQAGAQVLFGRGFESEWSPPYGPFVDALTVHVGSVDALELRADLGSGASPFAQLVPKTREILSDIPEPVPVQPDEERFRLIDAVAQFLAARSRRIPLVVCLDDLQWAEKGTVAMLRHLARFAAQQRILVVGAFRGEDLDKDHPLTGALQALERETQLDHVRLEPLREGGVQAMLESFAQHELSAKVAAAWTREVGGNPFFIEEMVRHLIEAGDLYRDDSGRWTTTRPIRELTVPEGVHNVVARRLSRLSEAAQSLLAVAAAVEGTFHFDIVSQVAGLSELDALDAIEEAVEARVLKDAGSDTFVFANALIRHSLYDQLISPRRIRLHRRMAEALSTRYGARPTPAQAAEIAAQYHRSRALSGAETGVDFALVAADHAQTTGAHDEAAAFLRMGLDLLPEGDERRASLRGRLAIVLAWALAFDEAVQLAAAAGDAIAEAEGKQAAAAYLSDAAYVCAMAGGVTHAWALARAGLTYAAARDVAWARLVSFDYERRSAEDPEHPGLPIDSIERRESARILRAAHLDPLGPAPIEAVFDSREEALGSSNLIVLNFWAGEYAYCLPRLEAEAEESESLGRLARAARAWANAAYCDVALGQIDKARSALEKAQTLADRVGQPIFPVVYAEFLLGTALDDGWDHLASVYGALATSTAPALAWAFGMIYGAASVISARLGRTEEALGFFARLSPWLEKAPAWTISFNVMVCGAAETLWLLERVDHDELVERALREKVLAPDFRHPMMEGRLALGRLSALRHRYDEAQSWFAEARRVLSEQGARPLLAITDYDEALMYVRRGEPGDFDRARPLVEAASRQFEAIGMTGWIRRVDQLDNQLG
jgi:class 3 adenylate cyclase/tetratricopeptide (TPR) repeat protein